MESSSLCCGIHANHLFPTPPPTTTHSLQSTPRRESSPGDTVSRVPIGTGLWEQAMGSMNTCRQSKPEDPRSGGGGTNPSPQKASDANADGGGGGGANPRGVRRPEPVPPLARGDEATEGRDTSPGRPAGQTSTPAGAAWACRHRGLIAHSHQRLWPRRG